MDDIPFEVELDRMNLDDLDLNDLDDIRDLKLFYSFSKDSETKNQFILYSNNDYNRNNYVKNLLTFTINENIIEHILQKCFIDLMLKI